MQGLVAFLLLLVAALLAGVPAIADVRPLAVADVLHAAQVTAVC